VKVGNKEILGCGKRTLAAVVPLTDSTRRSTEANGCDVVLCARRRTAFRSASTKTVTFTPPAAMRTLLVLSLNACRNPVLQFLAKSAWG
jgi:hypothetical protein